MFLDLPIAIFQHFLFDISLLSSCRNLVLPTAFIVNTNNEDKNVTQSAQVCQ
jgi:hypothetical protein